MIEYTHIKHIGSDEIKELLTVSDLAVVETKVDGAQARTVYDKESNNLIFGSRKQELTTNTKNWIFIDAMKKAFLEHPDAFVPNIQYCSESLQPHTIKYKNIPPTIGYDCIDLTTGEYLPWRESKKRFEDIGIPFIHVYTEKPANELSIEELMSYVNTPIYHDSNEEGVVVKIYSRKNRFGRVLFGKIVTDEFKEQNRKVFGEHDSVPKTPIESEILISNEYMTTARFNKAIHLFKAVGTPINMQLMPTLFKYVVDDILSEHILDISKTYESITFKRFNNIVAKTCASMLKEYLFHGSETKQLKL